MKAELGFRKFDTVVSRRPTDERLRCLEEELSCKQCVCVCRQCVCKSCGRLYQTRPPLEEVIRLFRKALEV